MFCCTFKRERKHADKIEGMASWLILGGVLPLAITAVAQNENNGIAYDVFFYIYLWVIAMGAASLRVKRASQTWRVIVALGAIGFIALGIEAAIKPPGTNEGGLLWPIAMLALIYGQYRADMKMARVIATKA